MPRRRRPEGQEVVMAQDALATVSGAPFAELSSGGGEKHMNQAHLAGGEVVGPLQPEVILVFKAALRSLF